MKSAHHRGCILSFLFQSHTKDSVKTTSLALLAACIGLTWPMKIATADSTQYDWLAGTQWYVPAPNLLAYLVSESDLSNNLPVADQTLWDLTSSVNGVITGTSVATFTLGEIVSSSTSAMNGVVTESGQIRIIFTLEGTSDTQTIGIGQFRNEGTGTQMEMQMITGSGGAYLTHWAYMAEIPDPGFVPPTVYPPGTLVSQEWNWTAGTTWNLTAPGIFGTSDPAQFFISNYVNGYFWGTGTEPTSAGAAGFSQIGSITPEGNVLFSMLIDGELVSLAGQITGNDATDAHMLLRGYDGTDSFGDAATALVIPEPSSLSILLAMAGVVWILIARRKTPEAQR